MLEVGKKNFSLAFYISIFIYYPAQMGESAGNNDATGKLGQRAWLKKRLYQ